MSLPALLCHRRRVSCHQRCVVRPAGGVLSLHLCHQSGRFRRGRRQRPGTAGASWNDAVRTSSLVATRFSPDQPPAHGTPPTTTYSHQQRGADQPQTSAEPCPKRISAEKNVRRLRYCFRLQPASSAPTGVRIQLTERSPTSSVGTTWPNDSWWSRNETWRRASIAVTSRRGGTVRHVSPLMTHRERPPNGHCKRYSANKSTQDLHLCLKIKS